MPPNPVRNAYYDAPDGQVHYRYLLSTSDVKQKYPIILMHMSAASSFYFAELMSLLAGRGYDCYAPDMPGFGRSYDPPAAPASTGYYVDVFRLLPEHLGIKGFHLLGHHTGAGLGVEWAALYPSGAQSLCCIGLALLTAEEQGPLLKMLLAGDWRKPSYDGAHVIGLWENLKLRDAVDVDTYMLQYLDQLRALEGRTQVYNCVFVQDAIGLYEKVQCPVQVLGSKESMLWRCMSIAEKKEGAVCDSVGGGEWEVFLDPKGVSEKYQAFLGGAGSI